MLISILLTLESDTPVTLPPNLGRANYAATLRAIQQVDPALSAQIHDAQGPKPITCSDLWGTAGNREGTPVVPGRPYQVRITGLTAAVSQVLAQALLTEPPATWELDGHPFRVTAATADEAVDPWAGRATYAELAARYLDPGRQADKRIGLILAAPTGFRSQGMHMPLPLPELVFGSLVDRWNAFAPMRLSPDVRRFAAERVAINRFDLRSRPVEHKRQGLRIGGVGRVHYVILSNDAYWRAALNILADFARFGGVGVQTSTGMGQVRRLLR